MRSLVLAVVILLAGAALLPLQAGAKGCIKGAAIGGVAGHVAGHHAVAGAAVGCVIGHHRAKVKEKEAVHAAAHSPDNAAPSSGAAAVQ